MDLGHVPLDDVILVDFILLLAQEKRVVSIILALGPDTGSWRCWPQSDRLPQASRDVRQLAQVLHRHLCLPNDCVNFLLGFLVGPRIAVDQYKEKAKHPGSCLVPCKVLASSLFT